jgi:peptide/nickel transport system permease protein
VSLIGVSLPTFLIGILLHLSLRRDPRLAALRSGAESTVRFGWWSTGLLTWSGIKALIMPSIPSASSR